MQIVVDVESRSAADLKKCGAHVYWEHPTTELICLGYQVGETPAQLWRPGEALPAWLLEEGIHVLVAHNVAFEKAAWRRMGWPQPAAWLDTMAVCARKALPQSLGDVSRLLGLTEQKDTEGKQLIHKLCKPNRKTGEYNEDPALLSALGAYCLQDVRTEHELHKRLGDLSPSETRAWRHNEVVNERGLPLDMGLVANMQACVNGANGKYLAEFRELTGVDKPGSPKFLEWVNDRNSSHFPNMKAETVTEALADWPLTEEVRHALILRKKLTSASIKKLASMRACVGADSRARGLLQYHGAATGRVAGRLLQPTNFPRGSVELGKDEDGRPVSKPEVLVPLIQSENWELLGAVAGCPIEAVSASLRNIIRADKGRLICAADYSTIEVRILLALAGQWDKLELMKDKTKDVYCDFAGTVYGVPMNKVDHAKERQAVGKPGVLSLGFAAGHVTLQARYMKKSETSFCQDVVHTYRKEWAPEVPKLWRGLEEAACRAMWDGGAHEYAGCTYKLEGEFMTCRLPSNRKLFYFAPERTRKAMPWSTEDEPDIRPGWSYKAKKMGKWVSVDYYGGHATENVVQALSRDLTVSAAMRAEEEDMPVILQVYDEIITEPLEKKADWKVLAEIMSDVPQWARQLQLPIASEGFSEERYRK